MSTKNDSNAEEGSESKSEALDIKKDIKKSISTGKKTSTGQASRKKTVKKKKPATKKKAITGKSRIKKKSESAKTIKKTKIHENRKNEIEKTLVDNGIEERLDAENNSRPQSIIKERPEGASTIRDNIEPAIGGSPNKDKVMPGENKQLTEFVRVNYIYIILAILVVTIILFVFLGSPNKTPGPLHVEDTANGVVQNKAAVSSQKIEIEPIETAQSENIEEQSTVESTEPTPVEENSISIAAIEPVLISTAQLVGEIQLDNLRVSALRTLFARGGWGVERDRDGSLILVARAINKQQKSVSATTAFNQQQLVALASLLRPRGWVVRLDAAGDLILIPGSAVTKSTPEYRDSTPLEQTGLTYLNSLLELRGWQIGTEESGAMILIPYNAPQ